MCLDKLKNKYVTGAWISDVKHYFNKINQIIDHINGVEGCGTYKVISGFLTQTGVEAPTATIVANNTDFTPTFSYTSAGIYNMISSEKFTTGKTYLMIGPLDYTAVAKPGGVMYVNSANTTSNFRFSTYASSTGTATNGYLLKTPFELRIYN